jgi:predicted DNA-binding transcriptional regulator YafY
MESADDILASHIVSQEDQDSAGNFLKHESAERIFNLLLFLFANHDCTRKEIFEHLASYYRIDKAAPLEQGISRRADRMFERDINFLEDLGFEIKKVRGKGRLIHYSLVKGSGPRASFLFTQTEVDSLALLHNLFADPTRYARPDLQQPLPQSPPRNPFSEEILAFIEKLASTLPPEQRERFNRSVSKPFVYFNLSTVADYLPHRPIIDIIVRAISHRQQIQFRYASAYNVNDGILHEHIDPYYITYMEGHFYLIAFSHKKEQFLEYRIDRIKAESLQEMPSMIDIERRRRPFQFRFWLDGSIAKRGISQRWLTQTIEREEAYLDEHGREQRRALIRATAYSEWRVIQQLLRYGEKAELIEPPHLREQMKKVVKRMWARYE